MLVSDGSKTLIYFVHNSNVSLQRPNYLTLDYSVYNFKLKQLEEKVEGYALRDADNRSDIICIDKREEENYRIFAYLNKNINGFHNTTFADFNTDYYTIIDLEVGDIDGYGYNDVIVICKDNVCNGKLYAKIYQKKN